MIENSIKNELKNIVGKDNYFDDVEYRVCYSYDATRKKYLPDIILRPANTNEISEIMVICNKYKIPVIPRGAGTGFSGGSVPINGGIVIDMTRFNKIIEINQEDLIAVVQTGVITADLDKEARNKGLFYPPDPSSSEFCTIGGNIAENAGGPRAFKYGVTKDFVLALEAVIPTGQIINTGAQTIKSVSGYNLTGLLVGSEGTLGIFTQAILKLKPLPASQLTVSVNFDSIKKAAQTVSAIISNKLIPCTIEFMDGECIKAVENYLHIGLNTDLKAMLLIELDGDKEEINNQLNKLEKICLDYGAIELKTAREAKERELLWKARKAVSPAISKLAKNRINEDIAVPRSKIPDIMEKIEQISKKYDIPLICFGHAGDGNIHVNVMTDEDNKQIFNRTEQAIKEIFESTLALNGTLSGEHGIGYIKAPYLNMEIKETELNLMKEIKKVFDPNNILNPHKIFIN